MSQDEKPSEVRIVQPHSLKEINKAIEGIDPFAKLRAIARLAVGVAHAVNELQKQQPKVEFPNGGEIHFHPGNPVDADMLHGDWPMYPPHHFAKGGVQYGGAPCSTFSTGEPIIPRKMISKGAPECPQCLNSRHPGRYMRRYERDSTWFCLSCDCTIIDVTAEEVKHGPKQLPPHGSGL